mgnify:CR=1 FL=1
MPEVYRRVLTLRLDDLPVNDTLKRYSGMTEITAATRALFKSLGLPGRGAAGAGRAGAAAGCSASGSAIEVSPLVCGVGS